MKSPCYCSTLRAAARKATALYDEALAPAGVNVAQYGLLRRVERRGTVSLTELGRLSELDRSTVGRNARVLERLGLARLAGARAADVGGGAGARRGRAWAGRGREFARARGKPVNSPAGSGRGSPLQRPSAGPPP